MTTTSQTLPYRPDVIAETMGHSHRFFRRSYERPGRGARRLRTTRRHAFSSRSNVAPCRPYLSTGSLDALETGEYDMDFERHFQEYRVESLEVAFAWVDRAFDRVGKYLADSSAESLAEMQPDNAIMNGPKGSVFAALLEHTRPSPRCTDGLLATSGARTADAVFGRGRGTRLSASKAGSACLSDLTQEAVHGRAVVGIERSRRGRPWRPCSVGSESSIVVAQFAPCG